MSTQPIVVDPSQVQSIQVDPSQVTAAPAAPSGFWDKVQANLPGSADTGLKGAVNHIQDTLGFLKSTYDVSAPGIAQQIYKKLSGQPNELKALPGKMVTAFALGAEPEMEGAAEAGAPRAAAAAPEAAAPAADAASDSAVIGRMLDVLKRRVGNIPGVQAAKDLDYIVRGAAEEAPKPPAAPPTPPAPPNWGKGQFGTPVDQWGQRITSPPPEVAQPAPPAVPAAQEPAAIPSAAASPAAVPPAPTATPQTAKATLTDLQQQIKDSLGGKTAYEMAGGKPLQDGVSLKNQRPQTNLQQQIKDAAEPAAPQTPKAPQTDLQGQIKAAGQPPLPDDFTATPDSSLLKGYKYDPAKKQFSVILNDGKGALTGVPDYVRGEVSAEQFKAFEDADSKGSAWTKKINQGAGTVLVEKQGVPFKPVGARRVVVDPATGTREFSDVIAAKQNAAPTQTAAQPTPKAAPPAGSDDLTSLLQQSLEQVPAAKGGVFTTAAPADLAKRWGVDESSIADTDANLRGLNAQQSQAYIDKLAKSYKSGTPVEPVMETRDAENNIISVDGRHRALAAQKAGVERIPVIVRRLQPTSGAVQ